MKGTFLLRLFFALAGIAIGSAVAVWVVLWIGTRAATVRVPDLAGLDMARAAAALDKVGLVARLQDGEFSATVATGLLARQRPAAG
ncbi:MAG: PASTA domain-containing protein, partial [Acidobacteria bacterium]|nr:PASTA domain-containing protein [Acidobacteriota bacterium]